MKLSFILLGAFLLSPPSAHSAEEQPKYSVIETDQKMQVRQYDSYYVAQTVYDEADGESSGDAFRRLFRYITGENTTNQDIEMTAPVTMSDSVEIEMTAPVTMEEKNGKKVMTFMVPSRFKKSEIPIPTDPLVEIVLVPSRLVAVHSFSWFSGEEKRSRKALELKEWLQENDKYLILQGPIYAGYNSPFSFPGARTHEMMFVVEEK